MFTIGWKIPVATYNWLWGKSDFFYLIPIFYFNNLKFDYDLNRKGYAVLKVMTKVAPVRFFLTDFFRFFSFFS